MLFHRGYLPYLDVQTIEVTPVRSLSGSAQVGLPVRWVAILRDFIEASLGATGGVHTDHDVIRLLLAGADAVMMSSALLENGPEHLKTLEKGLAEWMAEQQYASVEQLKGSASRESMPEPAVYERVSYVKSLWSCFRSLAR